MTQSLSMNGQGVGCERQHRGVEAGHGHSSHRRVTVGWRRLDRREARNAFDAHGVAIHPEPASLLLQLNLIHDVASAGFWPVRQFLSFHVLRGCSMQAESGSPSYGLLQALVESAPDALIVAARDGRIELVNAQAERLFGYQRHELLGQRVEVLIPERYRGEHPGHRSAFFESPKARAMEAGLELYGRRRDGSEFPVEISLSPIETENGILTSAAIRDVSQRKRYEAELERTSTEVRAANQELEAFAYSVSHDLRAPLRSMSGFAEILRDDHATELSPRARHDLDVIIGSASEMSSLIDDLLSFSRFARQPVTVSHVDVQALALQITKEQELKGRRVRFRVDTLPLAMADGNLLRHVLANLISNAVKFTRGRASATIQVGWDDAEAAYFVRDNGIGFNMEHAGQLFGVFQRLHKAEDFEGTGVGLAIVRRIVSRHGGKVWAHAEVGMGATFWFKLGGEHARK